MIILWLLIFSICMGIILLTIHNSDEIHLLMVWLSGLLGLVCILILVPPLIKGLLGLIIFAARHRFFPTYNSLR